MKCLLILSIFIVGCAPQSKASDPRTIFGVDPLLQTYVNIYIGHKNAPLYYEIPVQFTDLPGDTVGLCTRWSNGYRQIQIDKDFFMNVNEQRRVELIEHELGHCDLNRGHTSTLDQYGWPTSYMYPYIFDFAPENQPAYETELFSSNHETDPDKSLSDREDIFD